MRTHENDLLQALSHANTRAHEKMDVDYVCTEEVRLIIAIAAAQVRLGVVIPVVGKTTAVRTLYSTRAAHKNVREKKKKKKNPRACNLLIILLDVRRKFSGVLILSRNFTVPGPAVYVCSKHNARAYTSRFVLLCLRGGGTRTYF